MIGFQLFLAGPPAAGKTTAGRVLARSLGIPFHDLDECVSEKTGLSPGRLLREQGEEAFRRLEYSCLRALPDEPAVVALGGGTLTQRQSLDEARRRGVLVGLRADPGTLLQRLEAAQEDRPLLGDENDGSRSERLVELLRERAASYESVDLWVGASQPPEQVASLIEEASLGLRLQFCRAGEHRTRVLAGHHLADALLGAVRSLEPGHTLVVLTDEGVPAERISPQLDALRSRFPVWVRSVPGGEACKTWHMLESVLDVALAAGAGRQSVVVGIGGGALLDLAAMVAALLGRGAPLVLVPSTVLAQVDACVGGKCAINTRAGRNLVGTFHPARQVIVDLALLSSLPAAEYRSGLVEALKVGLIADPELFWQIVQGSGASLAVVDRAIELKCRLVERDPWDRGERMLLNLGHTFGHAIEAASAYTIRHGTAVAWGLRVAVDISREVAGLSEGEAIEIRQGLTPFLETPPATEVWTQAMAHLRQDKKGNRDGVDFIALRKIGEAVRRRLSWTEIEGAWLPFGGASK